MLIRREAKQAYNKMWNNVVRHRKIKEEGVTTLHGKDREWGNVVVICRTGRRQ